MVRRARAAAVTDRAPTPAPLLDVQRLSKRFGGVVASAGVDLQVIEGEVHALIGPNGAGKTTLVAQLAGQLRPDSGRIVFAGADITRLAPHERARRGLARSFQITRLFRSFDVLGNVALAVQAARTRHPECSEGSGAAPGSFASLRVTALELLAKIGLEDKAAARIDELSHGEQRALEVGLAIASRPRLVLLDEPMAGMGHDESRRMEALIDALRRRTTVLLIEHDVDAVFRLADRVSVLVSGSIVASGAPDAVRRDAGVIEAYLGEE
jgi:branched-chain amino acid transport system ATP-binding protein